MSNMTQREKDAMTLPLACASGAADAFGYMALSHVFTANMTGNTVLLGLAIGSGRRQDLVPALVALAAFALGVLVGGVVAVDATESVIWPWRTSLAFGVEAGILIGLAIVWVMLQPTPPVLIRDLLTGGAAMALGMQSAIMQRLKIPGIVTTYITGTLTTLMVGLEKLVRERPAPKEKKAWEERSWSQSGVLVAYLIAAAAVGFCLSRHIRWVVWTPSALVLSVAVYSAARKWRTAD